MELRTGLENLLNTQSHHLATLTFLVEEGIEDRVDWKKVKCLRTECVGEGNCTRFARMRNSSTWRLITRSLIRVRGIGLRYTPLLKFFCAQIQFCISWQFHSLLFPL